MYGNEQLLTEEDIKKSLEENLLGRNDDVIALIQLISENTHLHSIAIDGRWGCGKTFFVKQTNYLMNTTNNYKSESVSLEEKQKFYNSYPFSDSSKKYIEQILTENKDKPIAVYYDAWANDNDEDPVLSILYQIVSETGDTMKETDVKAIIEQVLKISEAIPAIGRTVKVLQALLNSNDPLKEIKAQKNLEQKIRSFFDEVLEERGNKLVIFVDELDRCRPNFAVELLEKVKHYLLCENVVFVFSVNLQELQHTIQNYYGNGFDACRYLDRFFDIRTLLVKPDTNRFYSMTLTENEIVNTVCEEFIDKNGMQLREIIRYFNQVRTCLDGAIESLWSIGYERAFAVSFIVPIIIGLNIVDINRADAFLNGRDPSPLLEMNENMRISKKAMYYLMTDEETSKNTTNDRRERLLKAYNAIFVKKYTSTDSNVCIGRCVFNEQVKEKIQEMSSIFSQYRNIHQ